MPCPRILQRTAKVSLDTARNGRGSWGHGRRTEKDTLPHRAGAHLSVKGKHIHLSPAPQVPSDHGAQPSISFDPHAGLLPRDGVEAEVDDVGRGPSASTEAIRTIGAESGWGAPVFWARAAFSVLLAAEVNTVLRR